jgi:hypothetical protein
MHPRFQPIKAGRVNSTERYFVRIRLETFSPGQECSHDYSAAEREVPIQFPVGTIGDTLGWLPYAVKFKEHYGCRLTCGMGEKLIPLFSDAHRQGVRRRNPQVIATSGILRPQHFSRRSISSTRLCNPPGELIMVWLEVRVLPGPPRSPSIWRSLRHCEKEPHLRAFCDARFSVFGL